MISPLGVPMPTVNTRTPRSAAISPASIGSGPVVVWPSVSRMIAADVYEPGGTGLARGLVLVASARGRAAPRLRCRRARGLHERRSNSTSGKIVFSDTRMPLPTAVPRCSWKRSMRREDVLAVVRRRLHDRRGARRTRRCRCAWSRGWSSMNALAAACAAAMRLGLTSAARMLPDTSIARIIVSCCDGSVTTAAGRAIASIISVSASRNSTGGTWRRHAVPGAHRLADHRQVRVAQRRLLLAAQQPADRRAPAAARAAAATASRARGRSCAIARPGCAGDARGSRRPSRAGCGACAGRRSAGSRRPGRRRWQAPARRRRRRGSAARSSRLAPLARPRRSACGSRLSWVSTNSCSPVSASCDDEQAEVGQLHLQRIEQPHRDRPRAAARAARAARSQPGRADEIGDDEHQRAPRHHAIARVCRKSPQIGRAACAAAAARVSIAMQDVQHVAPAAARRDHRVDAVAVEQRADAVAVPREQAREHRDELGRHRALAARPRAEIDRRADRSSRNQAVTSRSSL